MKIPAIFLGLALSTSAGADPSTEATFWVRMLPFTLKTKSEVALIQNACIFPTCNPTLLQVGMQLQRASLLKNCLIDPRPEVVATCTKFVNYIFPL